jgi:predicted dinucleotide-binding enzyme
MDTKDLINGDLIVQIYSGSLWEAEIIKSLLTQASIKSYLNNRMLNAFSTDSAQQENVQVMILGSDSSNAKSIISQYLKNSRE